VQAVGNSRGIKGIASASTGHGLACCPSLHRPARCSSKRYRAHPRGETAPQNEGTKAVSWFLQFSRAVLCRQRTLYTVTANINSQMAERNKKRARE